jgi:hypothetical protein
VSLPVRTATSAQAGDRDGSAASVVVTMPETADRAVDDPVPMLGHIQNGVEETYDMGLYHMVTAAKYRGWEGSN